MRVDPRRVHEMFDAVFELAPAERDRRLAELCSDPDVRTAVQDLLDRADAASTLSPDLSPLPDGSGVKRNIGPYRVLSLIGEGGMGTVYLVVREDIGKRAALKVLRSGGYATRGEVERFLRERRILAALDHPGIAALLDAGFTEGGLPYFVMEHVRGEPLDSYCDARRVDVATRLDLFGEACAAVDAAHNQGIVHRDLKPSNILVDDDGRIRLLDFGIGKAVGSSEFARSLSVNGPVTATGDFLATPEYASPEQIRGEPSGLPSDVYSLGVVLYELLAGSRPHRERRGTDPYAIVRAVIEDDPVPPSLRLARDPGAPRIAADRGSTPGELRKALRNDLDAIVMKCLSRRPDLRYENAGALATDLRRHRENRPIGATAPARTYRLRKWAGRRRREILAAVAVACAALLSAALALTSVGSPSSTQQPGGVVSVPLVDASAGLACDGSSRGPSIERGVVTARRTAGEFVFGVSLADGEPHGEYRVLARARTDPAGASCGSSRETGFVLRADSTGFAVGTFTLPVGFFSSRIQGDGWSADTLLLLLDDVASDRFPVNFAAVVAAPRMIELGPSERLEWRRARLRVGGAAAEAERVLRERLEGAPEDPSAWDAYADWWYHYGPLLGRPGTAARDDFERVLELDPHHVNALVHLVYIAAQEDRQADVERMTSGLLEGNRVDVGTAKQMRVLRAVANSKARGAPRDLIRSYADSVYFNVGGQFDLTTSLPDWSAARGFLDILLHPARPAPVRASARLVASAIDAGEGRLDDASRNLDAAAAIVPLQSLERRVLIGLHPLIPTDRSLLAVLRDSLEQWTGSGLVVPLHHPFGTIWSREEHPTLVTRHYLVGRLALGLDDLVGAEREASTLEGLPRGSDSLAVRAFALELRARVARTRGDADAALALATQIMPGDAHGFRYRDQLAVEHRLLIAELLVDAGRLAEAAGWYESLDDLWPFDAALRPVALLRSARLHEALARPDRAERNYRAFLDLWAESDSALASHRREAERALAALGVAEDPEARSVSRRQGRPLTGISEDRY